MLDHLPHTLSLQNPETVMTIYYCRRTRATTPPTKDPPFVQSAAIAPTPFTIHRPHVILTSTLDDD